MNKSSKHYPSRPFHTIYVEQGAYDYPLTQTFLQKVPTSCDIVPIRHYKDVFNRPGQHYPFLKNHPALILAVKTEPFLYNGAKFCQNFGHALFYYTSFLLNCIYDCNYCYLQGLYPSPYLVAFVNTEDFKQSIHSICQNETVFLAASYDTDLMALHGVLPYLDYFYDFFCTHSSLFVEVRTKSANTSFYQTHEASNQLIFAFTLTPQKIINAYENHTPSLAARLNAAKIAMDRGFPIRLCFDPILLGANTQDLYEPFFHQVFQTLDPQKIHDASYGFFRMSKDFFKRIEKHESNPIVFSADFCTEDNMVTYPAKQMQQTKEKHFEILTKYLKKEKIFTL